MEKVRPGQRLHISAAAYNAFVDAVDFLHRHQHDLEQEGANLFRQSGIVKVKNSSGADQGRFAILGVAEPIILPADNVREFKRQVTFTGVVPGEAHKGQFVVLLEPLAQNRIGTGVLAGVVPVRLQVDPEQLYDHAEIIVGNTQVLSNRPHGSAKVLWIEDTAASERWAIVRLDDGDLQAHVLITSNVPDEDGYYPGQVQRYDLAAKTWQTLFDCKVLDINN